MREMSAVSTTNLPEGTKRKVETDHQYVLERETRKATEKKRRPTSMPENYKKGVPKRILMRSLAPTHPLAPSEGGNVVAHCEIRAHACMLATLVMKKT